MIQIRNNGVKYLDLHMIYIKLRSRNPFNSSITDAIILLPPYCLRSPFHFCSEIVWKSFIYLPVTCLVLKHVS